MAAGLPAVLGAGQLGEGKGRAGQRRAQVPRWEDTVTAGSTTWCGAWTADGSGGHAAHRVTEPFLLFPAPILPTPGQTPDQTGLC